MSTEDTNEDGVYRVVVNDEGQHSIWRDGRPLPRGWRDAGARGTKAECLDHIGKVWTDLRPLSVRRALEAASLELPESSPPSVVSEPLVSRLASDQPIRLVARSREEGGGDFVSLVEHGRVFVLFERTGTELGIRVTPEHIAGAREAVARGESSVSLGGELVLDWSRVRFTGVIDPATGRGTGRLGLIEAVDGL